jgi:hypothetical protein
VATDPSGLTAEACRSVLHELLEIARARAEDSEVLSVVSRGEKSIDVDQCDRLLKHFNVKEGDRAGREAALLAVVEKMNPRRLADMLLAFDEMEDEHAASVGRMPTIQSRMVYAPVTATGAIELAYETPAHNRYRNLSSLARYSDESPLEAQRREAEDRRRRKREKKEEEDKALAKAALEETKSALSSPTTESPYSRRRKPQQQQPSEPSAPATPGRGSMPPSPATPRGPRSSGSSSVSLMTTSGTRNAKPDEWFTPGFGERPLPPRPPRTPGSGQPHQRQNQLFGEPPAPAAPMEGNSHALILGYIMKARSNFYQLQRSVAATYGGGSRPGSAASPMAGTPRPPSGASRDGLGGGGGGGGGPRTPGGRAGMAAFALASMEPEKYYNLNEYMRMRETLERDNLEVEAARRTRRHRAALRIQAFWGRYLVRRSAKQHMRRAEQAAVTIQRMVRGHLVRQAAMGAIRLRVLQRKYALRKIQTWYTKLRLWVNIAKSCATMRHHDRLAVKAWHPVVQAQRRQLMALEAHSGHNALVFNQLRQWRAVIRCQTAVRGHLCRVLRARRMAAIVLMQAAARGWRARVSVRRVRENERLRQERILKGEWAQRSYQRAVFLKLEDEMILRHVLLSKEIREVEEEYALESKRVEEHWEAWAAKMPKFVLKQPLRRGWAPQLDPVSGRTTYLNIASGEVSRENPNMAYVELSLIKGRQDRDRQFQEVAEPLDLYRADLEDAQEESQRWFETKIRNRRLQAFSDHTGAWMRTDFPRPPKLTPAEACKDLPVLPNLADDDSEVLLGASIGPKPHTTSSAALARSRSGTESSAGGAAAAQDGAQPGSQQQQQPNVSVTVPVPLALTRANSSSQLRARSSSLLSKLVASKEAREESEGGKVPGSARGRRGTGTSPRPNGPIVEAEVIAPYHRASEAQLTLAVGQIVIMTQCDPSQQWWAGELYGKRGIFPASCVSLLSND